MTSKAAIRQAARKQRAALAPEDIERRSEQIAEEIAASEVWKKSKYVALYAAFDSEVRTATLAQDAWATGKIVGFPRVQQHGVMLIFHHVRNWEELEVADSRRWAIPEPRSSAPILEPDAFDLWIVPGVAFDEDRNRLGYGKGFYDRALAGSRADAVKIGIAFEAQLVSSIPVSSNDVRMDHVVTESRWISEEPAPLR